MEENTNNLKNLLQNVAIIQKKYDDLAEYSGEHYNVFDILGVQSDELSHSAILTNLLDAKGKHGQKDTFLKLFIEQIIPSLEKSKYNDYINSFETEKGIANKEIHIGGLNFDTAEGGRVDIVVSSGNKHIVIENKIYASDQDQQLLRYNNHYKNDPILYLTLYGIKPSDTSKGNLVLGTDFICVSYKDDIANWLEKCIKEMVNKPIIRETLNQYLFLIKSLTNQSNNNKMSEEILNIMANNIGSSFEIYKNLNTLKTNLFLSFIEKIKDKLSNDININIADNIGSIHTSVSFSKINLNKIVNIELYFEGNDFSNVLIGACIDKTFFNIDLRTKFQEIFKSINFGKRKDYPNWYILYSYEIFDQINSSEFWIDLNSDFFVNSICKDLNLFIEAIDKTLK